MGIHIVLYTADGTEEREWDSGRYGGDREFVNLQTNANSVDMGKYPEDMSFRPKNFQWWREQVAAEPFQDRHRWLLDYLEGNPGSYINVG